jgi:hypothetical protein
MIISEEPTALGSVVRVVTERSKYPEIWMASQINGGVWYPDLQSWEAGSARHDFPQGASFDDLRKRGKVTLLTEASRETYEAGWRAACRAMSQAVDEIEYDCPTPTQEAS